MRGVCRLFLLCFFVCCAQYGFSQANTTNKGTEFWTAYMEHISGAGNNKSRMLLYITSDVSTTGKVEIANGSFTRDFTVPANGITQVEIPESAHIQGQGTFLKGIHIKAAKPVAVYAHILHTRISGATLLLPVNTLGKDYYSINFTQKSNSLQPGQDGKDSYSTFAVIATQDDTEVMITPSQLLTDGQAANTAFTVKLKKGEVYQGRSLTDLTGTRIQSISTNNEDCKKIAVFSGSTKLGIGCDLNNFSSDNVIQQVYPTVTWGKNYITVPLKNRAYDIYRVVVSDKNTNITLNGTLMNKPADGLNYIEFPSTGSNIITADKPVQVVQYAVSQTQTLNCIPTTPNSDKGDPEMIFLNPIEQTLDRVTLYSASESEITDNYINVVIKATATGSFLLDGQPYTTFKPVPGNSQYVYAQISVSSGVHNISAAEGFNAIAYGFGNFESYGYAAGANLENLNERIVLTNNESSSGYLAGCSMVEYYLQLILPYQTNKVEWNFKNGISFTDNNPQYTTTVVSGRTLYIYRYKDPVKYTAGDYSVVATVYNGSADECGSKRDVEFDFNIADPPVAEFKNTSTCLNEKMVFTDQTDAKGSTIKSWLWDFGDGTTSNLQSPEHQFATPGKHTVTLTVTNVNGCTDVIPKEVNIQPIPMADVTYPAGLCAAGNQVIFTGTSPQLSDIAEWQMDFGDGTGLHSFASRTIPYTYANTGTYTVKLIVRSKTTGCYSNVVSHSITVNPTPVIDFTLPEVCFNDIAKFTNNSTISDNTAGQLKYHWNFGEPASGSSNMSSAKDAQHKYARQGQYQVSLTVTSIIGCSFTVTKEITVNGDTFAGDIEVVDRDRLCSNKEVVFKNNVTPGFGSISKIEWYFDADGHPNDKVTYLKSEIPADGLFRHQYDVFNVPASKRYTVKMVVYTGESCSQEFTQQITVYANPIVNISPASGINICESDAPLQFNENKNGFTGAGTFSGLGISAGGLFDPRVAGAGIHQINYRFQSDKGCDFETTFQVVVNALPVITLKPKYVVFEGISSTLNLQVTGNDLTYKWYPSTGLDRDDVQQPRVKLTQDAKYKLTVTSGDCVVTEFIDVQVARTLVIPNTFTPNNDGINDTWNIELLESFPDCTLRIFNRNGTVVFQSVGYSTPWNGTQNGSQLPAGTYYYMLDLKDGKNRYSGYVTLLR